MLPTGGKPGYLNILAYTMILITYTISTKIPYLLKMSYNCPFIHNINIVNT